MSRKITPIPGMFSDMKTLNAQKERGKRHKANKGIFPNQVGNICLVSKYIFSTNHFNRMFRYDMLKLVFEVYVRVLNY